MKYDNNILGKYIYLLTVFECVHVKQKNPPGYRHPTVCHVSFFGLHLSLREKKIHWNLSIQNIKNRRLIECNFQTKY